MKNRGSAWYIIYSCNEEFDFEIKFSVEERVLRMAEQEEKKATPQKSNNNEPNISQLTNNADIKMLRDGLKKISSLGYD